MKTLFNLLAGISAFAIGLQVQAQQPHCGTLLTAEYQQLHPVSSNMVAVEQKAEEWLRQHYSASKTGAVVVIPVVVHVVYADSTMNISDAQILSQIDVLNDDFRRMNADTVNTRSVFKPFAADAEIEFCLAQRDPAGNPTTGITRTFSAVSNFETDDNVKRTSTGGIDPWPTDQYLNIWVCDLNSLFLGYSQLPGGASATDGVVIGYRYFGTLGTASAPYDLGRTTTHEIGHWLGLRHIWGGCTDDLVSDTPLSSYHPVECDSTANTCVDSPIDYPDMNENYMGYSFDGCMNLFTQGQKDRMWSFLNTARLSLQTSMGCVPAVAIDEAAVSALELSVSPNPSKGVFHLQVRGQQGAETHAVVTDLRGKVLWSAHDLPSQADVVIDLDGLSSGLYLLQVRSGNSQGFRKLHLVQ